MGYRQDDSLLWIAIARSIGMWGIEIDWVSRWHRGFDCDQHGFWSYKTEHDDCFKNYVIWMWKLEVNASMKRKKVEVPVACA